MWNDVTWGWGGTKEVLIKVQGFNQMVGLTQEIHSVLWELQLVMSCIPDNHGGTSSTHPTSPHSASCPAASHMPGCL